MGFLAGLAQVVVFLLLLKVSHILYWNVRKSYHIHPWLLELIVAVVLVTMFHFYSGVWGLVIATAIVLGLIRGDQESKSAPTRQLQ
ncbi:hypothetical protein EFBL_1305 [Effusibacillus lacus]|uniref:Uncharacterized protein n=2 Tax=Effusibacillus lacus TaxID=1348429 RepID=A0A292YL93_9BACL|nr:hypothetical protein EDD64_1496 [Effusibacillus lacus]GAX89681.1 hypothetical protein EFBL_1305 [Effusibacillus lacus]